MRLAAGQQDGEKAPFSIRECVNLRVAPAAPMTLHWNRQVSRLTKPTLQVFHSSNG
jgi:hypothetical protein